MWCFERHGPHTMHLKTIDTSSFAIIPILRHSWGHCHSNQCGAKIASQTHVPDTSVWAKNSGCETTGCLSMLAPLHHNKSYLNDAFSLVLKCILRSLAVVEYILASNVLPERTTFVACWGVPTNVNICLFLAFFLGNQVVINCWILVSLLSGSLISMRSVSNMIPKKDKEVGGPSNLSNAKGTPKSAHKDTKVSIFYWQVSELGGPIVKLPSK